MALRLKDVRALLMPEEPDYDAIAGLGADALPHLTTLIAGRDLALATKATSAAGFINDPGAVQVLQRAAEHPDPLVRVAAAGAAANLPDDQASAVLTPLIEDDDVGVQIRAAKSVPARPSPELQDALERAAVRPNLSPEARELLLAAGRAPAKGMALPDAAALPAIPELGEMPALEGPPGRYDEEVSADRTLGLNE